MAGTATGLQTLSDAIGAPLQKAFLGGGLALSLLTLGASLMSAAFLHGHKEPPTYILMGTGLFLILFIVVFTYFKDLRPLIRAQASIESNKELIDAVQQAALELTQLAADLQALAFKHANEVSQVLVSIRPIFVSIPILSSIVESETFTKAEELASTIVEINQKARKVIDDLRKALMESNPVYLKQYLRDIQQYRQTIEKVLAGTHYPGQPHSTH